MSILYMNALDISLNMSTLMVEIRITIRIDPNVGYVFVNILTLRMRNYVE